MDITGYEIIKYITSDQQKKKISLKEIKNIWTPKDIESNIRFNDIDNIDNKTASLYIYKQNKSVFYIDETDKQCPNPFITFEQKLQLKKYFINKMFIDKTKYKQWLLPNNFNTLPNTDKKEQEKRARKVCNEYIKEIENLKSFLFNQDYMVDGINDIIKNKNLIYLVINNEFEINNDVLTKENKIDIKNEYDLGKIDKLSDNIIKKRLLRCHFKKDIVRVSGRKLNYIPKIEEHYFDKIKEFHVNFHRMNNNDDMYEKF